MQTKLLRLPNVVASTSKSRSTIYAQVKSGLFTSPVRISARAVAWPESEVEAINAAHIAGKSEPEIRDIVASLQRHRASVMQRLAKSGVEV